MGITLGLLSKFGVPGINKILNDQVYERFFKVEEIKTFNEFHTSCIDLWRFLNDILPGKHYDAPSSDEIKDFYDDTWKGLDQKEGKEKFIEFIKKYVKESMNDVNKSRSDNNAVIMAGVVAPTAAVMLKRTGDNIPQVKRFKLHLIPNVIFVPSCTLLALIGVQYVQISQKSKA